MTTRNLPRNDAWRSVACESCGAAAGDNCKPPAENPASPGRRQVVEYVRRAFAAGSMNCAGGARERAYIAADPILSQLEGFPEPAHIQSYNPPAAPERLQVEPKPRGRLLHVRARKPRPR